MPRKRKKRKRGTRKPPQHLTTTQKHSKPIEFAPIYTGQRTRMIRSRARPSTRQAQIQQQVVGGGGQMFGGSALLTNAAMAAPQSPTVVARDWPRASDTDAIANNAIPNAATSTMVNQVIESV